jgi:hypothetical protein
MFLKWDMFCPGPIPQPLCQLIVFPKMASFSALSSLSAKKAKQKRVAILGVF